MIALNVAATTHTLEIPVGVLGLSDGALTEVWSGARFTIAGGALRHLKLAPRSGMVLA